MIRLTAHSTDDTRGIATAIAMLARAGDMFVLIGEMGSGKTTFSQHFAHALGVEEPVTSPTFNLDEIQCVVGKNQLPFGSLQKPILSQYADGVDSLAFLSSLK